MIAADGEAAVIERELCAYALADATAELFRRLRPALELRLPVEDEQVAIRVGDITDVCTGNSLQLCFTIDHNQFGWLVADGQWQWVGFRLPRWQGPGNVFPVGIELQREKVFG